MNFSLKQTINYQCTIPNQSILISQTQLYFLETYLKKKYPEILITKGFKIYEGCLVFEIAWPENFVKSESEKILSQLGNYLLIFQFASIDNGQLKNKVVQIKQRLGDVRLGIPMVYGAKFPIHVNAAGRKK